MRILIAEDELHISKIIIEMLSPLGQCDTVENGVAALEAYKKALDENNPYNLVCMDIMMPNLSGQETLKEMREIEKERGIGSSTEAKVIMITALDDQRNIVEAFFKGGASSYIVKPFKKHELFDEIKKLGLIVE